MSTLLLRLAAPLQAWGMASKFDTRLTEKEPTKSGVVGILACALGRRRDESLEDLRALNFGVRVDQPGQLTIDFQMVHEDSEAKGASAWVTYRHYLCDAVFVAGLEGEKEFLKSLATALQNPMFPIYLGRRSCPPTGPLVLEIVEESLEMALQKAPWQASAWYQKKCHGSWETVIYKDALPSEAGSYAKKDVPLSFNQKHRQYGIRDVAVSRVTLVNEGTKERMAMTTHDPMELLEVQDVSIKS